MDEDTAAGLSGRDQQPSMPFETEEEPFLDVERSDFQLLKRALLNERMAPDILQYKEELVQRVRDSLTQKEAELIDLESDKEYDLVRQLLSYERDRVRYLLKAYLRARLEKVQRFAGTVLDNAELRDKLSTQEQRFATDFFVAMGRHFKGSVLDDLPPAYQSLVKRYGADSEKKLLDKPDVNKYVFCQVLADCGQVPDGPDGQTAEMRAGDMMVVKYTTVARLVQSGQVTLV